MRQVLTLSWETQCHLLRGWWMLSPSPRWIMKTKSLSTRIMKTKSLSAMFDPIPPNFSPQFLLKVKEEYKMVKKLGSGGFASVFLVANQVKTLFTFWFEYTWPGGKWKILFNYKSWYSWPGGRTILCGKIPKDARQRREMERKDWGVSAQENGAVQVATLTSISRNYCLVTEKHGDIFPYFTFQTHHRPRWLLWGGVGERDSHAVCWRSFSS